MRRRTMQPCGGGLRHGRGPRTLQQSRRGVALRPPLAGAQTQRVGNIHRRWLALSPVRRHRGSSDAGRERRQRVCPVAALPPLSGFRVRPGPAAPSARKPSAAPRSSPGWPHRRRGPSRRREAAPGTAANSGGAGTAGTCAAGPTPKPRRTAARGDAPAS